jgi:hypothetical protein
LTCSQTATCKGALCPQCAPAIMEARAGEITEAITQHGPLRTYFASLTVRHKRTQAIELQHKLLTYSWGRMFSGRKGRQLAKRLKGPRVAPPEVKLRKPLNLHELVTPDERWIHQKPHSLRAHDRTYSVEHGFHLHLHCLLFLHQELNEEHVRWLIRRRWRVCVLQTIHTFKELARRALREGEEVRDRCSKVFGQQLFSRAKTWRSAFPQPRTLEWILKKKFPREGTRRIRSWIRKGQVSLGADICTNQNAIVRQGQLLSVRSSIQECASRILRRLKHFTQDMADIDREVWEQEPPEGDDLSQGLPKRKRAKGWGHGVHLEQVRNSSRIPRYLVKMGCELTGMFSKMGRVSDDGITHYGLWELANIAADPRHPTHRAARGAWRALYRATFATQTLTWSQGARDHFGFDERPDEEIEQDAAALDEEERMLGIIEGPAWDRFVKRQHQGFLAYLHRAHAEGAFDPELGPLPAQVAEFFQPAVMSWWDPETETYRHYRTVDGSPVDIAPQWWNRLERDTAAEQQGRAPPQPPPRQLAFPDEEEAEQRRREDLEKVLRQRGRTRPPEKVRPPPLRGVC